MNRPAPLAALALFVLAAIAILAVPALAHKKAYPTSMSLKAGYDAAAEIVTVTGKLTSSQARCRARREVDLNTPPDYETPVTVKTKADGSFTWTFHTNAPDEYEVSANAGVLVLKHNGKHDHRCKDAGKVIPIG